MDGQERRAFLKAFFGTLGGAALTGCAVQEAQKKEDVPYGTPSAMPTEYRKLDRVGGGLRPDDGALRSPPDGPGGRRGGGPRPGHLRRLPVRQPVDANGPPFCVAEMRPLPPSGDCSV